MDSENSPLEAWLELQQSYLETLRQNASASFPEADMSQAFEPNEANNMFRSMMDSGVPDELYASLTSLQHHATHFAEFAQSLGDSFAKPNGDAPFKAILEKFTGYVQQHTVDAVLAHWQLPNQLEPLLEFAKLQQTIIQDHPLFKGMDVTSHASNQFSAAKIHEQLNTSTQLITDYETALADYIEHHKAITSKAIKGLELRLSERTDGIESLSELHDLWVESYEASYSHTVLTHAYQVTHGAINNAVMALQKHLNDLRDQQLNAFGVATRKDVDLAFERQFALRKEIKTLRSLVGRVDYIAHDQPEESLVDLVTSLQQEVKDLRKQVAELTQKVGDC